MLRGSEPRRFEVAVNKSPPVFPPLLIVTVLPELLITLFEEEVLVLPELLLLMITEFPVLVITLFEVAVFTLFPPLDVELAEVLLVIDWVPPVTETLVPLPPPLITMLLPVLEITLLEVAVLVLPELFTLVTVYA